MKTRPTAAQFEVLKQTIKDTSNDLEYVTELLVAELKGAVGVEESVIRQAVQTAAQRCLWLAVWDKARSLGLDLPEYSRAGGTKARLLVDAEAAQFTRRLAAGRFTPGLIFGHPVTRWPGISIAGQYSSLPHHAHPTFSLQSVLSCKLRLRI